MGFFSNLFKKKSSKLTKEQIDTIDEKVELTEEKFSGERKIWADLSKPSKKPVPNPAIKQKPDAVSQKIVAKKVKKPVRKKARKVSKKKVKGNKKKKRR
jgi:hypothetical protein